MFEQYWNKQRRRRIDSSRLDVLTCRWKRAALLRIHTLALFNVAYGMANTLCALYMYIRVFTKDKYRTLDSVECSLVLVQNQKNFLLCLLIRKINPGFSHTQLLHANGRCEHVQPISESLYFLSIPQSELVRASP